MLQEWANTAAKQLNILCEVTKETLETCKGEEPQNYKQLIEDLKDAEDVRRKEAKILEERTLLRTKFGRRFSDLDTPWDEILSILDWTRKVQALFGSTPIPEPFTSIVSRGAEYAPPNSDLIKNDEAALNSLAALEARFETELTYQNQKLQEMSLETIRNRVKWLRERVDDLQVWIDFKNTKHLFSLRGLDAFFDRLTKNSPSSPSAC